MTGATAWLVQQWNPGTRFTLLDEPAVAPNRTPQYRSDKALDGNAHVARLLYADKSGMGLQARFPKRCRVGDPRETEGLDLPVAENEVASWVPLLAWEDVDFDRIEPVERDALLLSAAKGLLDHDPTIRKPIPSTARIRYAKQHKRQPWQKHMEVDRQDKRDRDQSQETAHRDWHAKERNAEIVGKPSPPPPPPA